MVTTFASDKAFLGIAPETTVGTAVAPTFTVPFEKCKFDDKTKILDDPSLRGSMAMLYDRIQGVLVSDWEVDAPFYADTFEHFLVNILGDRTTTGSADPYVHATSLYNTGSGQPKTHTFTYVSNIPASTGARVYVSAVASSLNLKWDAAAQLAKFSAKGMAWGSAIAAATPTASPSSVSALASWRAAVGWGGTATGSPLVTPQTLEIDIKREAEAHYTLTGGQQPYILQRGSLGVSGKMKIIAADESFLVGYLANTKQQFQIVMSNGITLTSPGARALTVDMQNAAYKVVKLEQGKTASMYEVDFDGIANSTNAGASGGLSPAKFTIVNGNAGTVY